MSKRVPLRVWLAVVVSVILLDLLAVEWNVSHDIIVVEGGSDHRPPQHGCHTGNTTVERLCAAQESNGALLRVQLDLYNKRRNAYAATGRIPSCALSSFHSDIRTCLDEVSKHCTHVSRCPLPDYVSPGNNRSVDNSSAIDTDQGDEVVTENALHTAAPTHVQQQQQQQSTCSSIIKPRVVSIMTMAAERWQRTAPSSNDPNGGGHTRMHYTCDTRNDFMEWNVSSRHLTMYCATFNETQHERDQLAKLHRLKVRWMRTTRGNLTIVEEWAAGNMNRSAAERQALRDDCALWQRTMEPLWTIPDLFSHESLAEEVLEGRRRMSPSSYSASSANTTLSNRSLHATRRKDDEIRVAVDWAVSATYENTATCRQLIDVNALSSMDKLYHIFPHSALYPTSLGMQKNNTEIRDATVLRDLCIRTAQNVLVSWLRHARLFQRDGLRAPRQEAYHQFRSALKTLNDEAKQRLVSSRNESKATNATPTDVFRDSEDNPELRSNDTAVDLTEVFDGMLQHNPATHRGCIAHQSREVRVAFVGDSTSVAYPRRIVEWGRRVCTSSCSQNGTLPAMDIHHYNFAVASTTVTDSDDNDDAYVRTRQYRRSLDYDPDVVVLMLGTNDALRCDPLEFDVAAFTSSLEALLLSYLSLPAEPDVLVLTPAPVFDSIIVNVTRAASRKHRERSTSRRVGFGHGKASACMAMLVESIRFTTARMSLVTRRRSGGTRQHVFLVDMFSMVLDDLTSDAISEAVKRSTSAQKSDVRNSSVAALSATTFSASQPSTSTWSVLTKPLPSISEFHKEMNHAPFMGAFPLTSVAGQVAIARAMADGCHHEKPLQKKIAAEVMRQIWLVERSEGDDAVM